MDLIVKPMSQMWMLNWKHSLLYLRDPGYTVGRIGITIITALVFGGTFYGEGKLPTGPGEIGIGNVQNILGSMYSGLSFMGMTNLISGMPMFYNERQVAYRCGPSPEFNVYDIKTQVKIRVFKALCCLCYENGKAMISR